MSIKTQPISLTINQKQYGPIEVPEGLMMIDFLHEYLDLTGSRLGCGQGICHACVAIVDHPSGTSEEVRTCITGAHFFNGKKVRTVEGHARVDEQGEVVELSPAGVSGALQLPVRLLHAGLRQCRHHFRGKAQA